MWRWVRWRRATVEPHLVHFSTQAVMALGQPVTSGVGQSPSHFWTHAGVAPMQRPSHFGTQDGVALCAVRVPRPAGSSFTYRRRAPRRPASASMVGAQRTGNPQSTSIVEAHGFECIGYRVIAHQTRGLPLPVGWMVPVGKGGARLSGRGTRTEPSTPLAAACVSLCTRRHWRTRTAPNKFAFERTHTNH